MNEVSKRAEELFAPILNENGYEIVEIRFDKQFGEDTLTVFVYKKGGITLEDCDKLILKDEAGHFRVFPPPSREVGRPVAGVR